MDTPHQGTRRLTADEVDVATEIAMDLIKVRQARSTEAVARCIWDAITIMYEIRAAVVKDLNDNN